MVKPTVTSLHVIKAEMAAAHAQDVANVAKMEAEYIKGEVDKRIAASMDALVAAVMFELGVTEVSVATETINPVNTARLTKTATDTGVLYQLDTQAHD